GAAAISGGRNIGDNYFDADRETNFEDVDLLVQGKAAAESRRSFDDYWNSPFAVPAAALVAVQPDAEKLEAGRRLLATSFQRATGGEEKFQAAIAPVLAELRSSGDAIWAPVRVLADSPQKVDPDSNLGSPLLDEIQLLMAEARSEVLLASAYLVPRKEGTRVLRETREAGVRVAVVTNSLAATDVPVVHAGYIKYRHRMLEHDIELYEYRPSHDLPRLKGEKKRERSRASLHTKSLVVDRRLAWIGSFNLDPRSALLNTELAFVVDSPAIAAKLADRITRSMAPERAWRLALGPHGLQWTGIVGGAEVTRYADPNTSLFMRSGVKALSFLPGIDNLL
ncbi:MAG: hypothetical protein IT483_09470, partial [Gammaproteobacteria bacterium]|nr:hypothetical protein [Gammaproteobacteria bacterium]